jgi:ABC-type uncharacterized transport system fused permease/ATPase subunit
MKLKFIRNWRQCLFKRFRKFHCKNQELKNWKKYFKKYNNQNSCTQHSCIQTKVFVEGVKINNEASKILINQNRHDMPSGKKEET